MVRGTAAKDESAYGRFWAGVGERFPDLGGAASTSYYAANEQRLFEEHLPALDGLRILKTDLWDEAKNTRILAWASARGARCPPLAVLTGACVWPFKMLDRHVPAVRKHGYLLATIATKRS